MALTTQLSSVKATSALAAEAARLVSDDFEVRSSGSGRWDAAEEVLVNKLVGMSAAESTLHAADPLVDVVGRDSGLGVAVCTGRKSDWFGW